MNFGPFLVEYRLPGHFLLDTGPSKPGVFILRRHMMFHFLPYIGMRYDPPVKNHSAHVKEVCLIDAYEGSGVTVSVSCKIRFDGMAFDLGELRDNYPDIGLTHFANIFRWLLMDRNFALYQMPGVDVHPSKPIATFDRFLQVCNQDWYDRVFELLTSPEATTPPESPAESTTKSP